jgi:hypothetical protein
MKPRLTTLLVILWLVLTGITGIAAQAPASQNTIGIQAALGTNFVYQGFLNNNGQPANGSFDFEFRLYDALSGGAQVGSTSTAANQAVSNGLFTVMIDFGPGAFNGSARFLQIKVRPAGSGSLVLLSPRVELAATPYAQYSNSTGGLQGRSISGAAPTLHQVLQWNGSQWAPASSTVAAPLNLAGTTGPILSVSNSGAGVAGNFVHADSNSAALRGANTAPGGFPDYGTGVLGVQGSGTTDYKWEAGVTGRSYNAQGNGVVGYATGSDATGVYGESSNGAGAYGIWGVSTTGLAGFFEGNVDITGNVSAGSKQFKIDDPLDPTNKYLYHTSVESPDMKNIYDGVVTLDANGTAIVDLPAYFQALNQDFRYQLTCIGGFAPIYVDKEIQNNRFSIAGGKPGMKVSWQVTGIRHDPYAQQNRSPVEQEKPAAQRGTYLYPSAYGQPETLGVNYARQNRPTVQQTKQPEGR